MSKEDREVAGRDGVAAPAGLDLLSSRERGGRRTGQVIEGGWRRVAGGVHGLRPPMRRLQAAMEMCGETEERRKGGAVVEEETEAKQTLKPLSLPTIVSTDFQLYS
jgi:hypothetical protein